MGNGQWAINFWGIKVTKKLRCLYFNQKPVTCNQKPETKLMNKISDSLFSGNHSRRSIIKKSLLLSSLLQTGVFKTLMAVSSMPAIKIGACDWSLGKASNVEAFDVAKEIGLDGIMVDMGSPDNDLRIRHADVQEAYKKASERTGIVISSLALGLFNRFPFHSDERTQDWIKYAIESAKNLNTNIVLLAFFNASDLRNDASRKEAAIHHLKAVMPLA